MATFFQDGTPEGEHGTLTPDNTHSLSFHAELTGCANHAHVHALSTRVQRACRVKRVPKQANRA